MAPATPQRIYTIGHSTRTIEEFLALLQAHGVRTLVDVRTAPGSRHNPQYGAAALAASLAVAGIGYTHLKALGGLRKPRPDSANAAWRNKSFRGYADHMGTPEFAAGLAELLAQPGPLAIMCAEAVPWRCHRSLIADALLARGLEVQDILGANQTRPHRLNPIAVVEGGEVHYPATRQQELEL